MRCLALSCLLTNYLLILILIALSCLLLYVSAAAMYRHSELFNLDLSLLRL